MREQEGKGSGLGFVRRALNGFSHTFCQRPFDVKQNAENTNPPKHPKTLVECPWILWMCVDLELSMNGGTPTAG